VLHFGIDHDDLLVSAALTARLDRVDWRARVARGQAVNPV
jgi:hypothetical protein